MNEYWDEQDEAARAERLARADCTTTHAETLADDHHGCWGRRLFELLCPPDEREREMVDDGGGAGSVIPTGSTMPRVNTRIPGLQPPSPSKAPRE